jgi:hypothetical protein
VLSIQVNDESQVGEARRLCVDYAKQRGFNEEAAGRLAIVTTELASNLRCDVSPILWRFIRCPTRARRSSLALCEFHSRELRLSRTGGPFASLCLGKTSAATPMR